MQNEKKKYSYADLIHAIQTIQNKVKKVHFTDADYEIVCSEVYLLHLFCDESLDACRHKEVLKDGQ